MTAASRVTVRASRAADSTSVAGLLGAAGLPGDGLERVWRTWVAEADGAIVGCASLERHEGALLLRSVAVEPGHRGMGIGTLLVRRALEAAGSQTVALLTETAPAWFAGFGFALVPRELLDPRLAASPELSGACPASARAMLRRSSRS